MIYNITNKSEKQYWWKLKNKKNIIKNIFSYCIVFILMMIFIITDTNREIEHCYGALYNRVYFISLYLPIYLIGLFSIVNKILLSEMVIRYSNKLNLMFYFFSKIVKHSFLYSLTFLFVNVILFFLLCIDGDSQSITNYIFLLWTLICQWIGWVMIGCLFLLSYIILQHIIISFMGTAAVIGGIASIQHIGESTTHDMFDIMYYFYQQENVFQVIKYLSYYLVIIIVIQFIVYKLLKKKDFIKKKKGESY
ncbi:hypothetical protein [Anaerovorax odorimutans]|uniref:hypothetical protein n=1 Tax=Anaerovorax odorimutans TaxID=109327 RepID=UPI0004236432|nr:hypothetical protein [Anaerovorax odorimutans]